MVPVVHHIEMCVADAEKTISSAQRFGFYLHAKRSTTFCQQWVLRVGGIHLIVTERRADGNLTDRLQNHSTRMEDWTVLCCEKRDYHAIDTVFNVALRVRNVAAVTRRIADNGGEIIQPPVQVRDEFGYVTYSIVKSCCGNVVHTLINKDNYRGWFLPQFESIRISGDCDDLDDWDRRVTHIDHVTLACHQGHSQDVISWYETCFGMQRFSINRNDDDDEGLVLEDGVGLRLKAMEYWRCAETGLTYSTSSRRQRNPHSVMFVVVESLPGQVNCNVETFLREHEGPGVEHVAFSTPTMLETVAKMTSRGVSFRQPPAAYYNQINKTRQIQVIGENLEALQTYGILLDSEVDPSEETTEKPKYLMQIFAHPLFARKTCFIEIIQRCGARGLGAGNILALVRSIREEEALKMKKEKSALVSGAMSA